MWDKYHAKVLLRAKVQNRIDDQVGRGKDAPDNLSQSGKNTLDFLHTDSSEVLDIAVNAREGT